MLYIFITGQPPFNGVTDQVILAKVKNGKFSLELKIFETISADAIDLLKGMLTYDPEKRLSAKEALQHPWFKKEQQESQVDKEAHNDAMCQLHKFNATQKLQQATMTMMVQNLITKEEIAKLQEVFNKIDENKDGKL